MNPKPVLVGQVFNKWTVLGFADKNANGEYRYLCRCQCGTEANVLSKGLRFGTSKGCSGCKDRHHPLAHMKHGMTGTPTYVSWRSMRERCQKPGSRNYSNYGGRGIKVCNRWESFETFLSDMGARPSMDYSIDRIDNNGHYEPTNCRWATRSEQQKNKRRFNQHDGQRLTGAHVATQNYLFEEGKVVVK